MWECVMWSSKMSLKSEKYWRIFFFLVFRNFLLGYHSGFRLVTLTNTYKTVKEGSWTLVCEKKKIASDLFYALLCCKHVSGRYHKLCCNVNMVLVLVLCCVNTRSASNNQNTNKQKITSDLILGGCKSVRYAHLPTMHLFCFKGIFSDSNNIFLWHKSEDVRFFLFKFQLILIFRLQVTHGYVHLALLYRLLC